MADDQSSAPTLDRFLVALALLVALLTTAVSAWNSSVPFHIRTLGWIAAQSAAIVLLPVAVAMMTAGRARRPAMMLAAGVVLAVPPLVMADRFAFAWIGESFLSAAVWRVVTELPFTLIGDASAGMFLGFTALAIASLVSVLVIAWVARRLARRWSNASRIPGPGIAVVAGGIAAAALAAPSLWDFESTRLEMSRHSAHYPLSALGIIAADHVTPKAPSSNRDEANDPWMRAIVDREHQHRRLALRTTGNRERDLPDIVIIIVESFRHELIDENVMPNTWRLATDGVHCRNHFSGGNATTHGMFSLFNGLEAIWYERPVRFTPLLNRLLASAGYELGFFAGHDQWRAFYMDGFINEEHFKVFETATERGLDSDRRATELASAFLERRDLEEFETRRPRLAMLYLYATHATYDSYPQDQVFQPAADDRLLYPYSQAAREGVWNRYKNSARTVDRFLAAVTGKDRIVVVTGDHGEAFLEDGTIGHGIRISKVQNMTPAVIYVPGRVPREIDAPTCHADLLPTLISALGLAVSEDAALDGMDLLTADAAQLDQRIFSTRNYLHSDIALIGPWTGRRDRPFAVRADFSIDQGSLRPMDVIDAEGNPLPPNPDFDLHEAAQRWIKARLGR